MANEVTFEVKAMKAFHDDNGEVACVRCYNTTRGGSKATFTGSGNRKVLKVTTTVETEEEKKGKLSAYFFPEDDDWDAVIEFGQAKGWLATEDEE